MVNDIVKKYGDKVTDIRQADGEGVIVEIKEGNRIISVRIMQNGGMRNEPYIRVTEADKGAYDIYGNLNNDRAATHINVNPQNVSSIVNNIGKILGK